MKASKKLGLLLSVAEIVLQYGADLTVELKDCRRSSGIVRGAISESETIDGGIVLGDRKHDATEFSLVDQYYWFDVIVDTSTGVMYARSRNGTLTVLVNADGSPKQFPGFDAKEDRYG